MKFKKGIITLSIIAASVFAVSGKNNSEEKYMHLSPEKKMKVVNSEHSLLLHAAQHSQLFPLMGIAFMRDTSVVTEAFDEGNEAFQASKNGNIAIYVCGAKGDTKTAKETAEILAQAFANRERTDKPVYITAFYEEGAMDGNKTGVMICMDGRPYGKNGEAMFTPAHVWSGIQIITDDFVKDYNGADKVIPLVAQQPCH